MINMDGITYDDEWTRDDGVREVFFDAPAELLDVLGIPYDIRDDELGILTGSTIELEIPYAGAKPEEITAMIAPAYRDTEEDTVSDGEYYDIELSEEEILYLLNLLSL